LAERILNTSLKTPLLLLLADLQPEFDQDDPRPDDVAFEYGTILNEGVVLVLRAEIHHVLHSGSVVPAAVKDDDFTGRREVLNVTLNVELVFSPVRRGRQRRLAEYAWASPLHDGLDGPALARRVAPFKHDNHSCPCLDHPLL